MRQILLSISLFAIVSCGGGGGGPSTPTPTYTVGGTVSGLTSGTLVLKNNNGDDLTINANSTSFTFATALASGAAYAVTVGTQPSGQTCSVNKGTGTESSANVTNINVTCSSKTYTVGGTVSGLNASGLVLIDGTNTVSISSGVTSFEFSSMKSTGGTYQVSIQSKPSTQTCSISNASGTVTTQSIMNIAISCVNNPIFVMYDETGNGILANSGTVITNDEVYFQLFFNDPVIVNSGTPTLGLNSGGIAYYEVGSNLETQYLPVTCLPNNDYTATSLTCLGYMRFKYTVASSDSSADLAISSINLNGSSIRNSSGGILDNSIIPTKNPQRSAYLKVN